MFREISEEERNQNSDNGNCHRDEHDKPPFYFHWKKKILHPALQTKYNQLDFKVFNHFEETRGCVMYRHIVPIESAVKLLSKIDFANRYTFSK